MELYLIWVFDALLDQYHKVFRQGSEQSVFKLLWKETSDLDNVQKMNSMFKQNMFRMCIIFSSKQSAYQSKALT